MAQVVGQLEISLLADLARLQTDMDRAKRAVGNAMSAIDKTVAEAAQSMVNYTNQSGMTTNAVISNAAKQSVAIKNAMAEESHYADLKKQWTAHNKSLADQEIADTKRKADALAAFHAEAQNAELNLIHTGRGKSSAMLTDKYTRLGFSQAEIDKQLSGLRQIEKANAAAFAAANPHIGKLQKEALAAGTSVKGLSASLRNVPAQFTDIFVSLQGGQAPLTVLLQQGGQLKDMFGGIGPAFRALGGYVLGLVNPFTIAAAAVGTLAIAYLKGSAETEAYNKALIMTGNVAGTTSTQLSSMTQNVAKATGGTVGAAAAALASLAGSSGIASAQFEKVAAVAVGVQKATGVAVAETVKQFAELGKDPLQASIKLNESTHFLTLSVYDQIKALVEQGRTLEAGVVAQKAYFGVLEERIPKLVENLGIAQKVWKEVGKQAGMAWDKFLGIGRDKDPVEDVNDRMKSAQDRLAQLVKDAKGTGGVELRGLNVDIAKQEKVVAAVKAEVVWKQNIESSKGRSAAHAARNAKLVEAQIVFDKEHDKFLSRAAQKEREILQAKNQYATVAQTQENAEKLKTRLAGIEERFKEPTKPKIISDAEKGLKLYNDLMDKSVGLTANFAEQQGLLMAKFAKDDNLVQYQDAMSALIAQQPYMTDAIKAEEEALKAEEKARKDSIDAIEKARNSSLLSHAKEIESLNDKTQKLQDEVAMYGMSKSAIEELTIARMYDRIEVLKGFDNSAEEIKRIEEVIAARRRLAAAGTAMDERDAIDKNDKKIEAESKKVAETLHNDVKGALAAAFRDTKDPMVAFGDALGNIVFTRLTNSIADAMATQLIGDGSKGSTGLFSGFMSLFSYAGGGYTGDGSRSGGVDGQGGFLSVLHPQETVIDHTRNAPMEKSGSKGDTFIININATVGDVASKTDVINGMRATTAQIQQAITRSRTHGGALA